MPEISRFYGIVIRMYFNDHIPPHFHAHYSGHEAIIARALGLVMEWASIHSVELLELWERARNLEPLDRIDPLP